MSKGSNRRPGKGYGDNYDRIFRRSDVDHTDIERLKRDAVIGRQIRSNNTIGYLLERLRQVEVQVSLIREELRQLEDSFK